MSMHNICNKEIRSSANTAKTDLQLPSTVLLVLTIIYTNRIIIREETIVVDVEMKIREEKEAIKEREITIIN